MERLTSYKNDCKREMICRNKDCDACEEHCPHINEDNCACLQEILDKLAEYEDLEEQGKLIKLPCAVGDTVYVRDSHIIEAQINKIEVKPTIYGKICYFIEPKSHRGSLYRYFASDFNKTVFLRKSAAEQALKERENSR